MDVEVAGGGELAAPSDVFARHRSLWRPPPDRALSEWADEHFYLSAESSAEPGRWRTLPYQRGIMDAVTDPEVERVSLMKSARVGGTKILNATIGYFIDEDPCPMMVVQPTIEDAKGYSQDEIMPMLRDVAVLRDRVGDPTVKTSGQTIKRKEFPGGVLQLVGANSPTGFRRVTRRVVMFDEVDAYPPSAGTDGDPVKLGIKRTDTFHNRKIIAVSTPLLEGTSRIKQLFEQGDRRRYHVPCPHCGYRDYLTFREEPERGHWMAWDDGDPKTAHFVCRGNGCVIEHHDKRAMLEGGEWVAEGEFAGHASFHIWAAYSTSPNSTWAKIAAEFLQVKDKPLELKVFVNTVLGETWQDRGEAPDWELLYLRRESYPLGAVPVSEIVLVTAGVDVQIDRFVYEVVGWALDKQSWTIDTGEIHGDTADAATWMDLDELLDRTYAGPEGIFSIARLAIDSGYRTQEVYNWGRSKPFSRVIACKGMATAKVMIGAGSPVDVTHQGRRIQRGYKVWPVAPHIVKGELFGWLKLQRPKEGEPYPPGWCHFPELPEAYFQQLTAEHLVTVVKRKGYPVLEWQLIPGRQNHVLDCRVLARVAAALEGLDRAEGWTPPAPRPPQGAEAGQARDRFLTNTKSGAGRQPQRWRRDWFKRRR